MRIRLDIAYDGTHFKGWAKQPGLRTVQGVLEQALERIVGTPAQLVVAGRTDAGVHASGQVAHVDLDEEQWSRVVGRSGRRYAEDPAATIAGRIRGVLGAYSDATVRRSGIAPEGFDARFSAVWRRYRYRLADDIAGDDPLRRNDTTRIRGVLDADAMDAAARSLIGLHDFAAYCKPREEATTIRTLLDYRWRRDEEGVLVAEVKADAFCHSMVRALVGACAAVGAGRLAVYDPVGLRDALERTNAFTVLDARGLVLAEVGYPADELLETRAVQTRARRAPRAPSIAEA